MQKHIIQTEKPNYFTTKYNRQINNIKISIFLVLLTVGSGAFVSGTNAGWAYNNFPYMGDNLLPPILLNENLYTVSKLFNDIGFIQFFHRLLATLTLIYVLITFFHLFKSKLKAIYFLASLVSYYCYQSISSGNYYAQVVCSHTLRFESSVRIFDFIIIFNNHKM